MHGLLYVFQISVPSASALKTERKTETCELLYNIIHGL